MHAKGYVPETIYMHLTYRIQSSCHQEISAPMDSPPREDQAPSTKTKLIQVY